MSSPGSDPRAAARAAKDVLRSRLAGDARVNGIGITRESSTYAVKVNVVDDADRPDLPPDVDGVPVRVVAIGSVTAL